MPNKMAPPRKHRVLEIMTLLLSMGTCLTSATIKFFDEPFQPRVYRGAPADTAVLTVNACRYVSEGCTPDPVTYTIGGADASLFNVDPQTALLQTADVVVQPLGHIYRLLIYAAYSLDGQNVVESRQILVEVSEENRFGPIFEESLYVLWAFRYWPPGTVAGRVSAKDADTQLYNRQITYSMTTSTGNAQFLFLNSDTGEISVAYPLPDPRLTPVVQLAVAASNAQASPVRSAITKVDVRISRLDAPAWLYAQEVTATSVYLCWERVQEPGVTTIGYNITWTDLNPSVTSVITVYIRGAHSDPMCGQVSGLRTWNNYSAVVHAWNNQERGPESPRLTFTPAIDGCVPRVCTAGTCERQPRPPGYRCVCPPGYSGSRCEQFNPCDAKPCQNLGACSYRPNNDYTCSCVLGYYGRNCSYLNRCALDPCRNGATCVNTSVIGEVRCECPPGYTGGLCEINEPCLTQPCENGGTCYLDNSPANARGYVCSCLAGYQGQNCQTFNPCSSSPCAEGGSCRAINDTHYECLCRRGFYGPRCQSLNPCISNPCQNGAECRNFSESFFCECGQGPTCSTVTNECVSNPCENGGNCRDLPSGFACDCQPGYFGPLCATVGSCPDQTVQDADYGQFVWQTVPHSTIARLPCPLGPLNAQATRPCRLDARTNTVSWLPPDFSACRRIGLVRAERLAAEFEALTTEQENLDADNLSLVANAMEQIVQYTNQDDQLAGSAVRILSNTMAANQTAMMTSDKQNQTATRLVKVVDRLLTNVALSSNQDLSLTTPNLALKIVALQNESSGQLVVIPTAEEDVSVTVSLPSSEIYRKVAANEQRAPPRAQFAVYSKDVFFLQEGGAAGRRRTVVAATVTQTELRDLRDPVVIVIPSSQSTGSEEEQCAYWNVTTGRWALNGVYKNEEASTGRQTVCLAYHLTNFALVTEADVLSSEVRREILLTSPSYIGCAVAIFFSFLTLFTYVLFRSVRADRSGKIVIQLTVSLLILNILFVLVSMPGVHATAAACVGAMFFMQAFVLTAFTWLLLDAHNLYHVLLTVFISYDSKFMLKRCAAAWGIPLLYVGFLVILDLTTYEKGEDYCYAPKQNSMVYYVGVMALMILLWLICALMWLVVGRVSQRPFAGDKPLAGDPRLKLGQIQASGVITFLMLITWLFGLLALRSRMLPLEIIFCLANIALSILLFISKCVTYSEAKASWIQLCRDGTLRRSRGSPASVASEDSGESESPIVLGRGLGRTGSRFGDVFASNSIITQNNVWSTGSQGKPLSPPQQSRTSGSKKYNSLRYGRTNVHFADFLDQQQQDEAAPRTYVTPPTRRLGDNHVTEL